MAGDWIKMRTNLWDDPRVARLCDLTDQGEAAVIGGLYWLWAMADDHSEDGILPGLTTKAIDRKTGVKGLGDALVTIGWLADSENGVSIIGFEDHNGASAKKRAQTAKRVADFKAGNAQVTQSALPKEQQSVSDALPREREEKRREEQNQSSVVESGINSPSTTTAGSVCARLRKAGVASVNPSNPKLLALIAAGLTEDELADIASEQTSKGKGFAWILAAAEGRRRDAAAIGSLPPRTTGPPGYASKQDQQAATIAALTGKVGNGNHGNQAERDITGESSRVA